MSTYYIQTFEFEQPRGKKDETFKNYVVYEVPRKVRYVVYPSEVSHPIAPNKYVACVEIEKYREFEDKMFGYHEVWYSFGEVSPGDDAIYDFIQDQVSLPYVTKTKDGSWVYAEDFPSNKIRLEDKE